MSGVREILFKGFSVDGAGWVQGDLLHNFGGTKFTIKTKDTYKEVDGTSICQYIGRVDITWDKIFEHDIVKDSFGVRYEVVFVDSSFRLVELGNRLCYTDFNSVEEPKIVGNMWTYNTIPTNLDSYRALVLLDSCRKLLERQENSDESLNLLDEVVYYDDALCDGNCLLNDIRIYFEDEVFSDFNTGGSEKDE